MRALSRLLVCANRSEHAQYSHGLRLGFLRLCQYINLILIPYEIMQVKVVYEINSHRQVSLVIVIYTLLYKHSVNSEYLLVLTRHLHKA